MGKFKMDDGSFIVADKWSTARAQYLAAKQLQLAPVVAPVLPVAPPPTVVKALLTPEDNFAGRSKFRYGIGEKIKLDFTTTPPGQAASTFGGLRWVVASGVASVDATGGNTGKGDLTCGSVPGPVKLQLLSAGGATAGTVLATVSIVIVEPNGARIQQEPGTGVKHTNGVASAGFKGEIFFDPVDVSFYRCEFREGAATYNGTGHYAKKSASLADIASGNIRHPTMGTWIDVGRGSAQGSKMDGDDTIEALAVSPPWTAGTFTWSISWMMRVKGTSNELVFTTANHVETLTAAGAMTISKGGTSFTRNATDPTTTF